jgi:hypothetical protein
MPQSMLITRPMSKLFPSTYPPSFHIFFASRVFHKVGVGYKSGAQNVNYSKTMTLHFHTVLITRLGFFTVLITRTFLLPRSF